MKSRRKAVAEGSQAVKIRHAFYIKLGRGGTWEADSLAWGLMRIGWSDVPLSDINERWEAVERQSRAGNVHPSVATRDINALREIAISTAEDVWITFRCIPPLVCCLAPGPVEEGSVSSSGVRRAVGATAISTDANS